MVNPYIIDNGILYSFADDAEMARARLTHALNSNSSLQMMQQSDIVLFLDTFRLMKYRYGGHDENVSTAIRHLEERHPDIHHLIHDSTIDL